MKKHPSSSDPSKKDTSPENLKVYYDGLCKVCSREIEHYKKQQGASLIDFVDICSGEFDAQKEGLDPHQVHKVMHARTPDGSVVTRVNAFVEIWKRIPRYHFLARWSAKPGVMAILNLGYSGFAVIRPWLPRYKNSQECSDSPYCEVKIK